MDDEEKKSARIRMIQLAVEAYGSRQHLAYALNVSVEEVSGWIAGTTTPTHAVFLKVLDVAFAQASKPALRVVRKKKSAEDSE